MPIRSCLALATTALWLAACGSTSGDATEPDDVEVCTDDAAPTEPEAAESAGASDPTEGPTVVLDGVPEVPDELRARLNQYENTRSAALASIAADGRSVVVLTRFAETAQIHEVREALGARRQLTFNDEPVRGAIVDPTEENRIVYVSDVGGAEDFQIFALDRAQGTSTLLTDGRSRHENFIFRQDGVTSAFSSNARNGRDTDVYLADGVDLAHARRITSDEGYWEPLDLSRDGHFLLVGHYVSINDSRVYRVDLTSGERTRLTPEAPVASYRAARFSADGARVYLTTDREGEFVELYEMDPASPTDAWRPLSRDIRWNVEAIALSGDGRTLAVSTNEDGFSVLRLLDTRSRRLGAPLPLPHGLLGDLRFARSAPVLGMTLSGATRTGDVYTYDLRARRLTRWTESEIGGLDEGRFIEPALVRFRSFDEREIPAFYYRPRGQGPFPVLVLIHGGPESQARPWFSALTQYLASEREVAVLVPNVRGSDGYGKSYLLLDNAEHREDSVRDIGALLDWVGQQSELDAARVGVYGGSYGGYMVLASLVHYGDRLRAGVDYVGISNFVTFLENARDYRQDLRRAEYGDERDDAMRA
ncbi:MAG: alpha/beta fold hydrolase, partial [Sandaracinaceae bacterium]